MDQRCSEAHFCVTGLQLVFRCSPAIFLYIRLRLSRIGNGLFVHSRALNSIHPGLL